MTEEIKKSIGVYKLINAMTDVISKEIEDIEKDTISCVLYIFINKWNEISELIEKYKTNIN